MAVIGLPELLLVLVLASGVQGDAASLVPESYYFKSRGIEINVLTAVEFASKEPIDGKTQITQLLALRWLAEQAATLKGSPKYVEQRQKINAIATGKSAQDPQGFAREYAARVLARTDGVRMPAPAAPRLRDSFRWFPGNASLLGAVDIRLARSEIAPRANVADVLKMVPPEAFKAAFDFLDKAGNIRIDRIAFAHVAAPARLGDTYIRLTGKAQPAWLVEALKGLNLQANTTTSPKGEAITEFTGRVHMMVFGDSDILMAGSPTTVISDDLLQVRAGKERHAGEGEWKGHLDKVPDRACGLLVGSVPGGGRQDGPVPMPVLISGHIVRDRDGFVIRIAGTMANAENAAQLVQALEKFRKDGLDTFKQLKGGPGRGTAQQVDAVTKILTDIQIQARENSVQFRLVLPLDKALTALPLLIRR